jgi:diguanylate cyclase (GGDEF)-like protein/PAS domain S-box-containing protein
MHADLATTNADAAATAPRASLGVVALVAFVRGAAGLVGQAVALPPGLVTPVAPAAGVALSAVLVAGPRVAPGVALGAFAHAFAVAVLGAGLPARTAALVATVLSLGALVEALAGAALVRRLAGPRPDLDAPEGVLRFLLVAGPLASALVAPGVAAVLGAMGVLAPADVVRHAATAWVGHATGAMLVTPIVLVWWGERGSAGDRRRSTVAISGAAAIALLLAAFLGAFHLERAQIHADFEHRSAALVDALRARLVGAVDAAHAVADFCGHAPIVEPDDFRRFAEARARHHTWVRAFGWIPRVPAAELARFEDEVRRSGRPRFRVVELDEAGAPRPPSPRLEHFPVRLLEPAPAREDVLGFDCASSSPRMDAIERARATAALAVTQRLRPLVAPDGEATDVLLLSPVFAGGGAGVPRGELAGLAVAAVPVAALVREALVDVEDAALLVRLDDLSAIDDARRLFHAETDVAAPRTIAAAWVAPVTSEQVLGGRRWAITIDPSSAYQPTAGSLPALGVLAGGLLTTVLAIGFLLVLTGHTARVERLVGERTLSLREANERLVAEVAERARAESALRLSATVFEASADAICVTDADSRILSVNGAFERITGYAAEEVVGATPRVLKSGRHDKAFYERMWAALRARGEWQGEVWNRRKDGHVYPEWLTVSAVRDDDGQTRHYVGISTDMSERKAAEERIEFLAHHDALTELPNRVLLRDRFEQASAHAQRDGSAVALVFLDLDHFKTINDSLGHPVGDRMLQAVAKRLVGALRKGDTVCRLGGDEFVLLLGDVHGPADVERTARKVLACMKEPIDLGDQTLHTGCSMGLSLYPADGADFDTLLQEADTALYSAKEAGRGVYRFFTPEMNESALERIKLESQLRRALDRDELRLHYQPQVDLASGRLVGVEALLRWQSPELGLVLPGKLVPVAEQSGLIVPIGEWVLREACRQLREWLEAGLGVVPVAVNISALQMQREGFVESVRSVLRESGAPPEGLELELTESMLARDVEGTTATLTRLKDLGLQLAIDDFGTGYSSLGYLERFAVDRLKIDQSFVRAIGHGRDDAAIVRAVIQMARALDLATMAEGVETEAQAAFLRAEGCEGAQGFHFGRPVPPEEILRLVESGAFRIKPG